jgi:hypothetical protein
MGIHIKTFDRNYSYLDWCFIFIPKGGEKSKIDIHIELYHALVPVMSSVANLAHALQKHKEILHKWGDKNHPCYLVIKTLIDQHEDMRLRDITDGMGYRFTKAAEIEYSEYFKEKGLDPQKVVDQWIVRAQKCERCACSGRWYPGDGPADPKFIGHQVTIKDTSGFKNKLFTGDYEENNYVLASELDKLKPINIEQLAMSITGYSLNISSSPTQYYRTDY